MTSDSTTGQSGLAYLTISGAGNLVSNVEVVTDVLTNDRCSIQSPDSAFGGFVPGTSSPYSIDFGFDGASMRLSANSPGDEVTPGCTVEFTATVASRGTQQALLGFNVFDVSIQGQALVSGKPVRFAPLQLNRIRLPKPIACEESPISLDGLSFTISNVQPATLFPTPTSSGATVVNIDGFADTISSVNLGGGGRSGCIGSAGTFSFDGTNLSFESSFAPLPIDPNCNDTCASAFNGQCDDGREGAATSDCTPGSDCSDCGLPIDPNCNDTCAFALDGKCDDLAVLDAATGDCPAGTDCSDCGFLVPPSPPTGDGQDGAGGGGQLPGVEPPKTCSITFSGKVAECGVFLPPIVGLSPASEVLRIEGVGSFSDGENSGELTTVYLTIHRGGAGACGVAMIPTMAMIFFSLCGFRLINRSRPSRGRN